ncbi:MAG: carbon-nitrogen hydrolase family protein [Gammaproteobacteria bacterium]
MTVSKLAVIQAAPEFLDKKKSIKLATEYANKAASNGARLVVFTEAFIAGYPAWIWRLRPGGDWKLSEECHARLLKSAVNIDSDDLEPLFKVAKKHEMTIVCGMNELDYEYSRSTIYNSVVVIGHDGMLKNRHRKLMPTNPERMVWGMGDASGLKVVDTPSGRVGALVCWENYMPLARFALYAQGIEIYIAPTYDSGDGWIGTLQHIAREGRCWVVGCGNLLKAADIPQDFPEKASLYPDENEWVNPGDSVVIAPGGEIVSGPLNREEGILYCDIDPARSREARRTLDVAGHYSRSDIFQLHISRHKQPPIDYE